VADLQEDFELPVDKADFERQQRAADRVHALTCPDEIKEQAKEIAQCLFSPKC
jgi:hypothetical protein